MKNNTSKTAALQDLIELNKSAIEQYQNLSLGLPHSKLSEWLFHFSEQKEIFAEELVVELAKFAPSAEPHYDYPFTFNKNKTIERKIVPSKRIIEVTKKQEQATILDYNRIIHLYLFPDSIMLTLMRQKDQIVLALRHLEKLAA